jgi:hypothetical protein
MREIEPLQRRETSITTKTWWSERSPLEKVGISALAIAGGVVAGVLLFPHVAAAATGGALTATGGYLLKKGFGR